MSRNRELIETMTIVYNKLLFYLPHLFHLPIPLPIGFALQGGCLRLAYFKYCWIEFPDTFNYVIAIGLPWELDIASRSVFIYSSFLFSIFVFPFG